MNQFNISGDMTRKPNFLELTQNTPSSGTKSEASTLQENLVRQQAQLAHCLPAVNQEKALFLQELEFLRQRLQHQQTLVESLTEQLVSSQEQIAQMERDFALLQQRHDEQRHLYKTAEANCQNLRTRLCRQQHQTLQFKAALEKCLETSTLGQNELGFDQKYSTIASPQPLLQPLTSHQPSPKADLTSVRTLGLADSSLSNQANHNVDISASTLLSSELSSDMKYQRDTHQSNITHKVQQEGSSEATDCPQEIVFPMKRLTHPSLFSQGQPVQPWSAAPLLHTSDSKEQRQEQSTVSDGVRHENAASIIQAEAAKAPKSGQGLAASTDSTRSSPLLDPLQPPSQRKPKGRVELPNLPRCRG